MVKLLSHYRKVKAISNLKFRDRLLGEDMKLKVSQEYFRRLRKVFKSKLIFFNWDSLHARLNSHHEAWKNKKKRTKRLKHKGNMFRKNLQLKDVC